MDSISDHLIDSQLLGSLIIALDLAKVQLQLFANNPDFSEQIYIAFGENADATSFQALWLNDNFHHLPPIEILSSSEINGAKGAFSVDTNTIYLASEYLLINQIQPRVITAVILEEIGHFVDSQINFIDAPGDEGAIFSALVRGIELGDEELEELKKEDDTVVIILNNQEITIEQATPGINPAFDLIGLTQLRNDPQFAGIDGSGFTVAVLDTGLDGTHPLISPNFVAFADFVDGGNSPSLITNASSSYDAESHGTHVAGTVGARDENIGVAPDVGIIGLRAIGTFLALRNALQWVLDNRNQYNIIALNMSLGAGNLFLTDNSQIENEGGVITEINSIIDRLENAGVTVVTAAGNDYFMQQIPGVSFPAISSTINVGAVWQDGVNSNVQFQSGAIDVTTGTDRVTSFSQRLDSPNDIYDTIFAPGALITSTKVGGGTFASAGTSQASPHVAGAVALMQEAALQFGGRLLTPTEVAEIIRSTGDTIFDGDDEDDNVQNTNTSYKRLNIYNAISEIKRRFEEIAPPPPGGGSGDPNGTIAGAYLVPTVLNGAPVDLILGAIGTDGGTVQVGNKDVDMFRFEVTVPGTVIIEVGSHPHNPDDFDSLLRLFDGSGNQLAIDDDGGVNAFSRLEIALNPGVYYAGVSGYDNATYNPNIAGSGVAAETGNYSLQFSLANTDFNGLLENAVPISLGTDIDPFDFKEGYIGYDYGNFVGTQDVDLFKVIVPDNGTLFIDIDTPFDFDYVDSYLRIFDADGNQAFFEDTGEAIVSDDDLSFDLNGDTEFTDPLYPGLVFEHPFDRTFFHGHTTDSFIAGTVQRGDVYYIGVSDFMNQDYNTQNLDNRSSAGTGGLYNLIVQFVNNDRNGSIAQAVADISLPLIGQPGSIGFDTDPFTGDPFIVGDLDVDFVKINSPTAGILEIDIDSYEEASIINPVDTVLSIFDAEGKLLAQNDDTNGLDPLLQYEIKANTDYFVAISGYGNDSFNPFMLGSGSVGDTGDYIFNARLLATDQFVRVLSNNAINNLPVETVNIGDVIYANIGRDNDFVIGPTDIDLYRFTATSNQTIHIRTNTYQAFSADTFLRFFDSNGNEIAFNDNENENTTGSYLEVPVMAGNQYYIGVNGASANARDYDPLTGNGAAAGSEGDYILTITATDDNPMPTIALTIGDLVFGGAGANTITITDSMDIKKVYGGGGDDTLIVGETGSQGLISGVYLFGGMGNDILDARNGGGGNFLFGGHGDDILYAGQGNDILVGGSGVDQFWLANSANPNFILDFNPAVDRLGISNLIVNGQPASFNDLVFSQAEKGVEIRIPDLSEQPLAIVSNAIIAQIDNVNNFI